MVASQTLAPPVLSISEEESPEMIRGILTEPEMNKFIFGEIISNLIEIFKKFIRTNDLGKISTESDVFFSETDKPRPDIVFISKERLNIIDDYIRAAPDLIVEVVSDHSYLRDAEIKKELYEQYGVPEYWLVLPHVQTVIVNALADGKYTVLSAATSVGAVQSKILAGLSIDLKAIF